MEKERTEEVNFWLKNNKNVDPFAANKFEREEFEKFVKEMEEAKITNILVTGILDDEDRIKEEGGPYADTLYITLPTTEMELKKAFMLIMGQSPDECSFIDETLTTLRLWWD